MPHCKTNEFGVILKYLFAFGEAIFWVQINKEFKHAIEPVSSKAQNYFKVTETEDDKDHRVWFSNT